MQITFLSCLALSAALLTAAGRPDFSGDWKMNAAKSDFGPLPAPSSMTRKIEHHEPELRVATTQSGQRGEVRSEYKYRVDGQEHVNKTPSGDVKSVLRWDGDVLEVDSERSLGGVTFKMRDRWALSGGGKILTTRTVLRTPKGEADITIVFEKQ